MTLYLMAKKKKYTEKHRKEVIRVFTTTSENSVQKITDKTGFRFSFVDKTITEHFKNKFNNK